MNSVRQVKSQVAVASSVNISIGISEIVSVKMAQRERELTAAIESHKATHAEAKMKLENAEKAFATSIQEIANAEFNARITAANKALSDLGLPKVVLEASYSKHSKVVEIAISVPNCYGNGRKQETRELTPEQAKLLAAIPEAEKVVASAAEVLNKCRAMLANLGSEERQIRAAITEEQLKKAGASNFLELMDGVKLADLPALPAAK